MPTVAELRVALKPDLDALRAGLQQARRNLQGVAAEAKITERELKASADRSARELSKAMTQAGREGVAAFRQQQAATKAAEAEVTRYCRTLETENARAHASVRREMQKTEAEAKRLAHERQAALGRAGGILGGSAASFGAGVFGAGVAGGVAGVGALAAGMTALGKAGVEMNQTLAQGRIGLTAITGSVAKADDFIARLKVTARETAPTFKELLPLGQQFLAVFKDPAAAIAGIRAIDNAVKVLAGGSTEAFRRANLAITQMASGVKIHQEELNQLREALPGLDITGTLRRKFGTADTEALQAAGVTGRQVADALIGEMTKRFAAVGPAMAGSITILFSGVQDAVNELAGTITEGLTASIGKALKAVLDFIQSLSKNKAFMEGLQTIFDLAGKAAQALADELPKVAKWLGEILTKQNVTDFAEKLVGWFQAAAVEVPKFVSAMIDLGRIVLPILGDLIHRFEDLVAAFDKLNPQTQDFAIKAGAIGIGLLAITGPLGTVTTLVTGLAGAFGLAGTEIAAMAATAVLSIANLAATVKAFKEKDWGELVMGLLPGQSPAGRLAGKMLAEHFVGPGGTTAPAQPDLMRKAREARAAAEERRFRAAFEPRARAAGGGGGQGPEAARAELTKAQIKAQKEALKNAEQDARELNEAAMKAIVAHRKELAKAQADREREMLRVSMDAAKALAKEIREQEKEKQKALKATEDAAHNAANAMVEAGRRTTDAWRDVISELAQAVGGFNQLRGVNLSGMLTPLERASSLLTGIRNATEIMNRAMEGPRQAALGALSRFAGTGGMAQDQANLLNQAVAWLQRNAQTGQGRLPAGAAAGLPPEALRSLAESRTAEGQRRGQFEFIQSQMPQALREALERAVGDLRPFFGEIPKETQTVFETWGKQLEEAAKAFEKDAGETFVKFRSGLQGVIDHLNEQIAEFGRYLARSAQSAQFSGARAGGGSVSGGGAYLVGERGPELFVPRGSGTIVPNGGGRTVHVTMHVSTPDATSFRRSQGQIMTDLARAANYHLARNG